MPAPGRLGRSSGVDTEAVKHRDRCVPEGSNNTPHAQIPEGGEATSVVWGLDLGKYAFERRHTWGINNRLATPPT